jgi:hypothetical protein
MKQIIFLLLFWSLALYAQGDTRSCALGGKVVDAQTGQAVAHAQVFAQLDTTSGSSQIPVRHITDVEGKFCFERLPEARYDVFARKVGYVESYYGARYSGGAGEAIAVIPGGGSDVKLRLTPQAVIGGALLDADRDPIPNGVVELYRRQMTKSGMRVAQQQLRQANDEGRFRFSGLPPGIYFVAARRSQRPGNVFVLNALDENGKPRAETEVETYYKAAISAAEATPITVMAGQKVDNLILAILTVPARHISGRVGGISGSRYAVVSVLQETSHGNTFAASTSVDRNGVFRIDGLPPARYLVDSMVANSRWPLEAHAEVDLSSDNVEGVFLSMHASPQLSIAVKSEGPPLRVSPASYLFLNSSAAGDVTGTARPEGTLLFANVRPDLYRIAVDQERCRCFIKQLSVNEVPQSVDTLDLRQAFPKTVEITVSSKFASLKLSTTGEEEPMFLLVNEVEPDATSAIRGDRGQSEYQSLVPGKYHLYAFQDFDPNLWGSSEVASLLAQKSVEVELKESDSRSVELPLITTAEFEGALRQAAQF